MNMQKLKLAVLACSMAVMLGACSTTPPTTVIGFNYEVDNAKANGIVQVFDLSGNTVVQVRDLDQKTTQFLDAKNAPIPFKVVGQTAVLAGMHSSFTVSTAGAASRVIRKPSAPLAAAGSLGAAPAGGAKSPTGPDTDASIAAEIARIRKELAELRRAVGAGSRGTTQSTTALAVSDAVQDASEPAVVIVSFPNNSRQFKPAGEQRSQLLALAHNAKSISVRGFTDSDVQTSGSVALAKARAEAAKRYLISMGVPAAKIVVGFDGAGKFIAENRSTVGRAANRRVEIGST